ncbi:Crp/Fnr family transcriptional regulator [Pedobacter sp. ISL-68]|uniref:Crp/Fnr family transcriptional regulator n=1 Tax=unclassified Pedobacter TaxID=2628915 RepID=UPI001BEB0864|nr:MULTISPECIES: Crp/Fnr family transcriptional regulator [unclassified Pedobacter]MBT2560257.1 Crp/Fnr family transcriptional regulator [Pedobacter sp. ISL-64]MBT2589237.1 Crp/Fnr family transcriptional regulator [Pedobacter sp. ISL-68]
MEKIEKLKHFIIAFSGMSEEEFNLSTEYWQIKRYKKGEFYNEYKNVCKHLGFVLSGVFRIYKLNQATLSEQNLFFFLENQFVSSFKSFLSQTSCEYYTESMTEAEVLYIHYDHLQRLYQTRPAWERFGRLLAEFVLGAVMNNTELLLFHKPQDRYAALQAAHPEIFRLIPLYHIASFLGIEAPSLSRIRRRLQKIK